MKNIKLLSCLTLLSITHAANYNNQASCCADLVSYYYSDYNNDDYGSDDDDSYDMNPEIIEATIYGNLDQVKNICTPTNINEQDCYGRTSLMHSCIGDRGDIFTFLMQNNADIKISDNFGKTALDYAIEHNRPEMIKFLLLTGADDNLSLEEALKKAAKIEINLLNRKLFQELNKSVPDINIIKSYLAAGADVNAKAESGLTVLVHSFFSRKMEIIKLLIDSGADINSTTNEYGTTTLMFACVFGDAEIVKLFIDAGHDVNARDIKGRTALMHLWMFERRQEDTSGIEIAKLLIDAGADVDATDNNGWTAIRLAGDDDEDIEELLKSYSNPFKRFKYKNANLIKALAIGTVIGIAYKLGQNLTK